MLVADDVNVTHDDLTLRRRRRILQGIVNTGVLQHFSDLRRSDVRMLTR
jgi:hypothetical protein